MLNLISRNSLRDSLKVQRELNPLHLLGLQILAVAAVVARLVKFATMPMLSKLFVALRRALGVLASNLLAETPPDAQLASFVYAASA